MISKISAGLILAIAFAVTVQAQTYPISRQIDAGAGITAELVPLKSATCTPWFDVRRFAPTQHTLTFTYTTAPSAATVTLQGTNDQGATPVTIATSTSITGATINGSGVYDSTRICISGLTGSVELKPIYTGFAHISTMGLPVIIDACSGTTCYTTPVAAGVVVITSGSTSNIFTSTTLVQSLRCNNQNLASVNFTVTDGNNAYFVGPNYVFAALSNVEFAPSPNGSILAAGLKASAGTASSINCWVVGKQVGP